MQDTSTDNELLIRQIEDAGFNPNSVPDLYLYIEELNDIWHDIVADLA